MGIKSINKIFREKCPYAFVDLPLSYFSRKSIAIDANNWIYARAARIHSELVYNSEDGKYSEDTYADMLKTAILQFIRKLDNYHINSIWCWDGTALLDKAVCHERRSEKKRILLEKIAVTKDKKLIAQNVFLTKQQLAYYQEYTASTGVPSFSAKDEAERLCASLSRRNYVQAVWSTDTDNYALGVERLITGFVDDKVSTVYLPAILHGLNYKMSELIDLCILLGCDFNSGLPGISVKRAWQIMHDNSNNLDVIALNRPDLNVSSLNHLRCRLIFRSMQDVPEEGELFKRDN